MLYPMLEEKLHKARLALDSATSESIIELCKKYLALLTEYRVELYRLPRAPELNTRTMSSLSLEEVGDSRKEVRTAIEHTTQERNQVEALILSFTAVSGYEATATLNRLKYKGHDSWELRAGGVRWGDGTNNRMTVQEAVEAASLLRREEHVAVKESHKKYFINRWGNPNRKVEVSYDDKYQTTT
jgi:hypothetical protein